MLIDDEELNPEPSSASKEEFSLVMRNEKLVVLTRLASITCGKCQVRAFGGLGKRRFAVIPDPKCGLLSVSSTAEGKKHVMWAEADNGTIQDDIIVNRDFEFECVPDQPRVVMLQNRRANGNADDDKSVMEDFHFNGSVRSVPGYLRGEFRALYWLQRGEKKRGIVGACEF